jgi:hypothetical protein
VKRTWMKTILTSLAGMALLSSLAGCGKGFTPNTPRAGSSTVDVVRRGPGGTTRFLAHNVLYRLDPSIALFLTDMNADVVLKDPTGPFVPANKTDYSLTIHHAIIDKDAASLAALMNNIVFADKDSPLRDVHISFKGDHIVMGGQMNKGIWVGFEMEGTLDPTPEGLIRMTPVSVKSLGVRVDGLLALMGIEMQKLMKTKEEKGVIIRGNQILMDPARLYPPPTLNGKVTAVGVRAGKLHIEFDDGHAQPWPVLPVPNPRATMCMWGGDVLINAALNLNTKFEILDSTPDTPMVFALDRYREQLEAGFVVPTRDGAMIAYVPDITNFDTDMGRYAPPTYPIPGIHVPTPDAGLISAERQPTVSESASPQIKSRSH